MSQRQDVGPSIEGDVDIIHNQNNSPRYQNLKQNELHRMGMEDFVLRPALGIGRGVLHPPLDRETY